MFQLEMESMSVVASTKAGERLNLTVFRITFFFFVSPTLLLFKWMQKKRHSFSVVFSTIPFPLTLIWGIILTGFI